jgi:hypothetical protein
VIEKYNQFRIYRKQMLFIVSSASLLVYAVSYLWPSCTRAYAQVDQNGFIYDPKMSRKCLKNGTFYGSIQCIYGPFSVRIIPYYLPQKYVSFCIRIVNGPYLVVFSSFRDTIQFAVLYRKVIVNGRKHAALYPFTTFLLFQHFFCIHR